MLGLKIENIDFSGTSADVFEQVWNTRSMPLNLYRKDDSVKFLSVTPDENYPGKENILLEVTKWPHLDETSEIVQRVGNTFTLNVTVDKDRPQEEPEESEPEG